MCCLKLESVGPGLMRRAVYYTTGKEPVEGNLPLGIDVHCETRRIGALAMFGRRRGAACAARGRTTTFLATAGHCTR